MGQLYDSDTHYHDIHNLSKVKPVYEYYMGTNWSLLVVGEDDWKIVRVIIFTVFGWGMWTDAISLQGWLKIHYMLMRIIKMLLAALRGSELLSVRCV